MFFYYLLIFFNLKARHDGLSWRMRRRRRRRQWRRRRPDDVKPSCRQFPTLRSLEQRWRGHWYAAQRVILIEHDVKQRHEYQRRYDDAK